MFGLPIYSFADNDIMNDFEPVARLSICIPVLPV